MLTLLAITELLYLHFHRLVQWLPISHHPYYRSKRISPTDKHNHRHTQQKPDWLKQEIICLKAKMPQAGCRTIADICNRRFAASRKTTVGKTYVHDASGATEKVLAIRGTEPSISPTNSSASRETI